MADTDLKVIVKAKELAVHSFKLTEAGKLPLEKLNASYGAWKNHISNGNCHGLAETMDRKMEEVINGNRDENKRRTTAGDATGHAGAGSNGVCKRRKAGAKRQDRLSPVGTGSGFDGEISKSGNGDGDDHQRKS